MDGKQAQVNIAGKGSVDLSAPTSGDMAGILFFADCTLTKQTSHQTSGGANVYFEGTLYFPVGDLEVTGNGTGTTASPYIVVIAKTYKFGGNGSVIYGSDYGSSDVPLPSGLMVGNTKLVE